MAPNVTMEMRTAWAHVRRVLLRAYRHYRARQRMAMFKRATVSEMVKKAAAIEPMIHLPRGTRKVSWPPRVHDCRTLFRKGRRLQHRLGPSAREVVILVAGGDSRAETLSLLQALIACHARGSETVRPLVVSTDTSPYRSDIWKADERADWFDFSNEVPPRIRSKFRCILLLDVLRGIRAHRMICLDSKLCHELLTEHARQLEAWMDLYAFLGTRQEGRNGNAHPDLLMFVPHLRGVFCTSAAAKKRLVSRGFLPPSFEERLFVIEGLPGNGAADQGDNVCEVTKLSAFLARTRLHARL